jgi:hypothetical protein
MPGLNEYDVFISYAAQDKPAAERFASALSGQGLKPWLGELQLRPGVSWREQVSQAMENADACVVLLSESTSPTQPLVSIEWEAIQKTIWDRPDFPVVPLQLESSSGIPAFLKKWQPLEISESDEDFTEAATRVVKMLKSTSHENYPLIVDMENDPAQKRFKKFLGEIDASSAFIYDEGDVEIFPLEAYGTAEIIGYPGLDIDYDKLDTAYDKLDIDYDKLDIESIPWKKPDEKLRRIDEGTDEHA